MESTPEVIDDNKHTDLNINNEANNLEIESNDDLPPSPPPSSSSSVDKQEEEQEVEDTISTAANTAAALEDALISATAASLVADSLTNSLNIENLNISQALVVNVESGNLEAKDYSSTSIAAAEILLGNNNNEEDVLNEDEYEILNKNDGNDYIIEEKLNELKEQVENSLNEPQQQQQHQQQVNIESLKKEVEEEEAVVVEKEEEEIKEEDLFADILGNGSLTKRILTRGDKTKRPKAGQICTINFKTFLDNVEGGGGGKGTQVESHELFEFILGDSEVVSAFDIAISLMHLNEESEIISDARHAYGEKGNAPHIPANAKLIYNVKLINFIDPPQLDKLQPIERLSLAETKKVRGNFYYNRQNYDTAVNLYKKGLKYFYEYNLTGNETSEDVEKFSEVKITLLMNVALSNFKLELYNDALESLDEVLKYQPRHLKALFIRGKILMQIGELSESIKYLTRALEIDEKNNDIRKELTKAKSQYKIQYDKDKEMYQKMIAGVTENLKKSDGKSIAKKSLKTKSSSSNGGGGGFKLTSYIAATGLVVAIASITIAFAKYKNYF